MLRLDDEGFRVVEAAIESVRRAGGPFGVAEALVAICRERLEGGAYEGAEAQGPDGQEVVARAPRNASHRIIYTVCAECGVGTQETSAGAIEVGAAELARRSCDTEVLDLRQGEAARVKRTIPKRIRDRIWGRDRGKCQVPGCGLRGGIEIHHVDWWQGGHDPARMLVLCGEHHDQVHDELLRIEGVGCAEEPGCGFEFFTSDGERLGRAGDRRREAHADGSSCDDEALALGLPPGGDSEGEAGSGASSGEGEEEEEGSPRGTEPEGEGEVGADGVRAADADQTEIQGEDQAPPPP